MPLYNILLLTSLCNHKWKVRAAVWTLTDGRGDASHGAGPGKVTGHGRCLGRGCCLSRRRLLLHLPVALTQVEHLAGDRDKRWGMTRRRSWTQQHRHSLHSWDGFRWMMQLKANAEHIFLRLWRLQLNIISSTWEHYFFTMAQSSSHQSLNHIMTGLLVSGFLHILTNGFPGLFHDF